MDPEALFREHHARLRRYLFRLTGDLDAADEALQETFVRVLERPPRSEDNVRGWLFTVATNVARDGARRSGSTRRLADRLQSDGPDVSAARSPLARAQDRELRVALMQALGKLNERERTAIVMREEGFAHREIAEALGSTTGTIGTLLARALAKLSEDLEPYRERS